MQIQKDLHVAVQYFLNADLDPDVIRRQVRELAAGGYQCIYGHARQGMTTPYLSEHWWRAIDAIVEECEALGVKFAIWDEDYYPSPSAGNRVMWANPEFAAMHLNFTVFEAEPGRVSRILAAEHLLGCFAVIQGRIIDVTDFCGTVCTKWTERLELQEPYSDFVKVAAPHWRTWITDRSFALEWDAPEKCTVVAVQLERNFGEGHNVDLLNADAVRFFLRVTHEKYLARYGQARFDRVFAGSFMDEPATSGFFPWTKALPEEFRRKYHEELLPLLPHLAVDVDENSRLHRLHYRELQRELICRNYLDVMQQWCAAHRIPSIGHLTRTEYLSYANHKWPNELRCCKHLDLPCTDPLGANMGWPDAASYHTGLKVAASAAYWFNKDQAGSDALAVCGSETDLSALRYMADYQMAFGISYFNCHGAAVSWAGPRKDEVPPSLFYQHSQWPLMAELWTHVAETAHRIAQGREHVTSVVYYPAAQFSTAANAALDGELEISVHHLSEALLSAHKEFVFIDGVTLCEQEVCAFARRYPVLIVPDKVTFFEPETEKYFEVYRKAGGRIVTPEEALALAPGVELWGAGAENVFVHRREAADCTLDTYLFNRADTVFCGTLEGKPVEVPPHAGCFAAPPRPAVKGAALPVRGWRVRFDANMVPLCRFALSSGEQNDLLNRRFCSVPEDGVYTTRFMAQGRFTALKLAVDAEMCSAPYRIFLNDRELAAPETGRFYDEENRFFDLLPALRSGSVPTQNLLRIECHGKLCEQSYLLGDFTAEFRHGGCALPYLTAAEAGYTVEALADWRTWGYGTYSGRAVYETELAVPETGQYRLDLGQVGSAAEVLIDGERCAVCYFAPYETDLALTKGEHALTLRVFNASGNRDRLSGRPAGVIGPVRLLPL